MAYRQRSMSVLLLWVLILPVHVITHMYTYTSVKREPLACSVPQLSNVTHTRYYYDVPLGSSIRLPACDGARHNLTTTWFVLEDLCRAVGGPLFHFASVFANGTPICEQRRASVSFSQCNLNYRFVNQSMIILNISDSTRTQYICWYSGRNLPWSDNPISYIIRIRSKLDHSKR